MAAFLCLARRCHTGNAVDQQNAGKQESNIRVRYVVKVWIREWNFEQDSKSGFTCEGDQVRDGSLESRDRYSVMPDT